MITEQDVLEGMDKPRTEAALKIRLDPGSGPNSDRLHDLLMDLRAKGKVRFDIRSGKWSKTGD